MFNSSEHIFNLFYLQHFFTAHSGKVTQKLKKNFKFPAEIFLKIDILNINQKRFYTNEIIFWYYTKYVTSAEFEIQQASV
jgi:hypothetical protein